MKNKMISRILAVVLVVAAAVIPIRSASPCDYTLNLFNHRLQGDQLRLYVEMQKASGLPGKFEVDGTKLDTVHNPGDAVITGAGRYQDKGNGLSTLLMLDRSESMKDMQGKMRDAAIAYIDSMDPQDEVSLYFFAQAANVYDFSDQPGQLRSTVHKEMPGKNPKFIKANVTPLYEHLMKAIDKVSAEANRELSFILIMTDGHEDVGGYTEEDVIRKAREKRVPIFAVGFYRKWKGKTNEKALQTLEKIAIETGGKYVPADAGDNLGQIFVFARARARNFLVIDTTLCGVTRDAAAQAKSMDVQVRYEDCTSNTHNVPLPPLEKDFGPCPQCRSDADCKPNEKCNPQAVCEVLPCGRTQKADNHQCVEITCGTDKDCPEGCSCSGGRCEEKPPCRCFEVYDDQKKECAGKTCQADGECGCADCPSPGGCRCCGGKCSTKEKCPAYLKEDPPGSCTCVSIPCKHDGQCPDGVACDNDFCVDPGNQPVKKAECKDGKLSLNGKCSVIKCAEDADCQDPSSKEKWVCAPAIGLSKKDTDEKTCQILRKGPCEKCEEEVDKDCRVVLCEKDTDCDEGCGCDDKTGECTDCGLCCRNPLVCGGIGLFGVLAIVFLVLALRKKKGEEQPLTPTTPITGGSEKQKTIGLDQPEPTPHVPERPAPPHPGGTQVDPNVASRSPFTLEIDIQGRTDRRPLPFGTSTVGRDQGTIVIQHDIVSSSHLTIDVRDSGIFVTDLGSTNGTYLDGRKLAPHQTTQLFLNQPLMLGGTVRLTVTSPAVAGKPGPARKNVTQILD